jgi:lysophospholipase L1-like esterase
MVLRLRSDVLALKPNAMVLLAGTNDIPSTRVPDLKQFIEDSFSDIFDIAEKNHIPVVVCSILPVSDAYGDRTTSRPPQTILELNEWLRAEAARRGLVYVDFYSVLQDGHDRLRPNLTADGLHPNAEGYALMEPLILKALHGLRMPEKH